MRQRPIQHRRRVRVRVRDHERQPENVDTYLGRDRGVRHHVENVAHLPLRPRAAAPPCPAGTGRERAMAASTGRHDIKRRQERHRPIVNEVSRRARESSRFAAETAEGIYVGWVMPQRLQQLLEGCIVRIAPAVIIGAAWRYLGRRRGCLSIVFAKGCLFADAAPCNACAGCCASMLLH